ncbi:hypothetical protein [Verminephrobacter eiseniae]|uniref:hypothetical protein n=1 Tax=Verminephrobacter eiseniae TaxID=364317 RepID=UPI0022375448|nr:hypothetical protein [Verminephrobacter eiseniae]MCW5237157.1 ACP S-malonyltransferase [Verminephrobacter eiseniae]
MAGMLPEYGSLLRSLDIRMPSSQILMNRSAQEPLSPQEIRDNLAYHVVETVRWRETVEKLLQRNKARFLEVGPRKVLCALGGCAAERFQDGFALLEDATSRLREDFRRLTCC